MRIIIKAALAAVILGGSLAVAALAAPQDYRFEPVVSQVKMGKTIVAIRLVDAKTGRPIQDAIILPSHAEMPMPGMAPMRVAVTPSKGQNPGEYRLESDLGMEGEWTFDLRAKVQGEPDTVRGTVKVKATK